MGVACLVVFIALLLLGWSNMVAKSNFYGIAESREIIVNSENPVEIEKVHVIDGQSVDRGQLLVQLQNPELTLKINQISHQLEQYRAQNDVDKTELESALTQLEAEKNALMNETDYRIRELKNEYDIDISLTSGLKSISGKDINTIINASHPILQKIERMRLELASAVKLLDVRIELQKRAIESADKPLNIQINQLEKELTMLKAENSKLAIYAPISGMIGSVNYKAGEKVTPFAAVMTLHSKTPSIVKGYLREDEYSRVKVNDRLTILSSADSRSRVDGTVVGVGSRIVEYPVRLRKHQSLQAWGREITIKIPESNDLILGEKVFISLNIKDGSPWRRIRDAFFLKETIAAITAKNEFSNDAVEPDSVVRPVIPMSEHGIEASAVVYLSDLNQYLLASDETPQKSLLLYLMDPSGQIVREVVIPGLDEIDDIESMTWDNKSTIYVAASMSTKKNNSYPLSRRLLVAIERSGGPEPIFRLHGSIDLSNILTRCADTNRNEPWANFLLTAVERSELDMEAMFWHENALFLGFKSPLLMKRSIILKIKGANRLLQNPLLTAGQVSIWQMVSLKTDGEDVQERISDLLYADGTLYITGVVPPGERDRYTGSLWKLNLDDGGLKRIMKFRDIKPEGITISEEATDLLICFDQGRQHQSQIALIKGVR